MPVEARRAVLPSPVTFHAKPTRGAHEMPGKVTYVPGFWPGMPSVLIPLIWLPDPGTRLPLLDRLVDAGRQFRIARKVAEEHAGVPVERAKGVVRVVGEAVVSHVVRRARLRLVVQLGREPELQVVVAARNRQSVVERGASA